MRYLLAIIFPPLAVLFCGKLIQPFLNLILWLCCWFPGVLHALFVVHSTKAEELQESMLVAMGHRPKPKPEVWQYVLSGGGVLVLLFLATTLVMSFVGANRWLPSSSPETEEPVSEVERPLESPAPVPVIDAPLVPAAPTVKPLEPPAKPTLQSFPTPTRTWTSRDGRTTLGSVLSRDSANGTVHLKRADGQDFPTFATDQLSEADLDYLDLFLP